MSKPTRSLSKRGREDSDFLMARSIISKLETAGVKLLALDFDKTIIDIHTAGYWKQGSAKLAEHVRPAFQALISASLDSGLHTCVVTYSMQPDLIFEVLKCALPKCDVSKVIIRANSKDWLPPQSPCSPTLGKEQHIAWITTKLFNRMHAIIQAHEICLMDDDDDNIRTALEFGHRAYLVPEDVSLEKLNSYADGMSRMTKSLSAT